MTLKSAAQWECIAEILLSLLAFPFLIVGFVFRLCHKPFDWLTDGIERLKFLIGHKLMLLSDEARNGAIKNPDFLKNGTAIVGYEKLKDELEKE